MFLTLVNLSPQDSHEFTKTECYHYFHCGCLARYIEFSLQQQDTAEDKTEVRLTLPNYKGVGEGDNVGIIVLPVILL